MANTSDNSKTVTATTGVDTHGTTGTVEVEAQGGLASAITNFGLRGDLFLAQLINFLIVITILRLFAFKPIMRFLAERETKIAESVKNADAIAKHLRTVEQEREEILAAARVEAHTVISEAIVQAEARKVEMLDGAKKEVERVIQAGKVRLDDERQAMLLAARKDIVDVAVKAAAKIVTDGMTPKKSQSLAEEMVRKLT